MGRLWPRPRDLDAPRARLPIWAGALAALVLSGCSAPPSRPLTGSLASPSPKATVGPHTIPTAYTTPLLDYRTDGHQIVWSRGAQDADPADAPDLWAFTPGDPDPTELFHNPNRDSTLVLVAVRSGRDAFVETNLRLYGENGYRLWLLTAGHAPALVDKSDWRPGDRTIPVPFMALGEQELIWAAVHHTDTGLRFELRSYDLSARVTTVLEAADADRTSFWFPSLDPTGTRLVYSAVDTIGGRDEFHVYALDLGDESQPVRLDRDGMATMPVIAGSTIVWKAVRENILNASALVRYSLSSPGQAPTLLASLGTGLTFPSIGTRYLAAWQDADNDVGLFDLQAGARISIDRVVPPAPEGRERAIVAGDLLVYLRADLSEQPKPLELTWLDLASM